MSYAQTLQEIRNIHYSYQRKDNWENFKINIDDFKSNPYTFLKWRFYLETSSLLLYVLIRTNIKPNQISLFYAFLGILTLLFLGLPFENKIFLYAGLFIAFSKTIIDACDGYIARLKNQKSISGFVLDGYGAHINAIGFQAGLGFYLANNQNDIFFYLVFLIPFFYAVKLKTFAYSTLLNEIIENKKNLEEKHPIKEKSNDEKISTKFSNNTLKKYYNIFSSILDDRARSVDFIILLFIFELNFNLILIKYIFIFLIIKHLIITLINIVIISNSKWLENKINKIKN